MLRALNQTLTLTALLFSQLIWAASADFNQQTLQDLFNKNQRQAAYNYSIQYLQQMEGDPYFDYLYGVSAIDTGHASQGVFALERVLLSFPEDHVARLELARGYFILEEYARAREEFETVLETDPPEGVKEVTVAFLDKIRLKEARYRTTSNGTIEIALGTDSNVNSGVDQGTSILGFTITDGIGEDDVYSALTGSWQITHPFAPGWMANAAITGSLKNHQDFSQYDSQVATLQAGITRLTGNSKYKASLLSQQYNLDSDKYRTLNGLNLDWTYALSQQSNLNTGLQYAQLDYPVYTDNNSDLLSLTVGYTRSFSAALSPVLISSISLGSETAEDGSNADSLADTERDIVSAKIGVVLNFSSRLALQMIAGLQTSDYAGEQTLPFLSGIFRKDDNSSADINLLWLFAKHWRLDTRINYSSNSSNVALYDYDRTVFSLNANYAF